MLITLQVDQLKIEQQTGLNLEQVELGGEGFEQG